MERPVLVTGGAGFIGSHLARRLLRDGRRVAVLIKNTTDTRRINDVLDSVTVVESDIADYEGLKKLLGGLNPLGVFHCAASNIKSGVAAPEDELIKVNVGGTAHLLKALEGIDYKFFINSGSYLEYGTKEKPFEEKDICEPLEIYALTKLAATLYCQSVARGAGKPIVTFRIFSPYGPEMERGRLIYEVVRHALENEEISLTRPETSRDFIFIEDIVDLYVEAMDKAVGLKGEIFNLGGGHAVTLKELVETALRLTDSKSAVKWGGAKAVSYDRGCQEANMEKTFSVFDWRPERDIDAGIVEMINWLKPQ